MIQEQKLSFQCPACRSTLTVPAHLAGVVGPCPHCRNEITAPRPQYQQPAQLAVRQPAMSGAQLQADSVNAPTESSLPEFPTQQPPHTEPAPSDEDHDLNLGHALAQPTAPDSGVDAFQQLLQQQQNAPQQPAAFSFPSTGEQTPVQPETTFSPPPMPEPRPAPVSQQPAPPTAAPLFPSETAAPAQQQQSAQPLPVAPPLQDRPAPQPMPAHVQEPQPTQQQPQQGATSPFPVTQPAAQPQEQVPGAVLPQTSNPPAQATQPAPANPFGPSLIPSSPAPATARETGGSRRKPKPAKAKKEKKARKEKDSSSSGLLKNIVLFAVLAGCAFGGVKFWPQIKDKASGFFSKPIRPDAGSPVAPSTGQPPKETTPPSALPLGPQKTGETPPSPPENPQPEKTLIAPPGPSRLPDSAENNTPPAAEPVIDDPADSTVRKAQPSGLEADENDPNMPPSEDIEAARSILMSFMNAKTVEDRLPLVQSPSTVEKQMRSYYNRHPYPMEPDKVEFKLANKLEGSESRFFVFEVTTSQQNQPFPVAIEETPDGLKVDWRSFVEFHDNMLGQFTRIYQSQPEKFRVMMERAHYFKDDVPDKGSKLCFRIKSPIAGFEAFAFAPKDTEIGRELDRKFEWDILYLPILELQWQKTPDGKQYVRVNRVVQDNWRASPSE